MSKLVYIAGPYTGDSHLRIEANIHNARMTAVFCAKHGIHYICPHLNSAHFELWAPKVEAEFYYEMDLNILARCDALVALPDWNDSKGAIGEVKFAREHGIPVFFTPFDYDELILFAKEGANEESLYSS